MGATALCYGIPDIRLPRVGGGAINPSDFVGHELVVFFCPAGAADAMKEVESFRSRAAAFADAGAWVIGILGEGPVEQHQAAGTAEIALASDPDGSAWAAFESLLDEEQRGEERNGGTFLFARGGSLDAAWPVCGRAEVALNALRGPALPKGGAPSA
jgi:peroxiredoxin